MEYIINIQTTNSKSPLLAKIKFEPVYLTGSLAVFKQERSLKWAGERGVWGIPPAPRQFLANSVWIFSNAHRHLENGGGGRIRTHGTFRYNGFQDRRHRPLGHSSNPSLKEIIYQ